VLTACEREANTANPIMDIEAQARLPAKWEPRLSRNGFALYDTKERSVAHTTSRNGVYPLTLQTIYPHFGFVAGGADNEMLDEKLFERLENGDEYPPTAFSAGEKSDAISMYLWDQW
jgi:hypothetical protein